MYSTWLLVIIWLLDIFFNLNKKLFSHVWHQSNISDPIQVSPITNYIKLGKCYKSIGMFNLLTLNKYIMHFSKP
jgi:hypothetical protein